MARNGVNFEREISRGKFSRRRGQQNWLTYLYVLLELVLGGLLVFRAANGAGQGRGQMGVHVELELLGLVRLQNRSINFGFQKSLLSLFHTLNFLSQIGQASSSLSVASLTAGAMTASVPATAGTGRPSSVRVKELRELSSSDEFCRAWNKFTNFYSAV